MSTSTTSNGNCLLFHGGGLCPLSNYYLSLLAEGLRDSNYFEQIYTGFFSFESLLNREEFIKPWGPSLKAKSFMSHGGFYGTSRGIDLTVPELQKQAIETCKALEITSIGVAGGDGTCRQLAEISEAFEAEGIQLFIPMTLTIDGIEGGLSLGLKPAVCKSVEVLNDLAATNLQTRDNREFSVLFLEMQGRNRDDILANTLYEIEKSENLGGIPRTDIDLFVASTNYSWNMDNLIRSTRNSKKRTVIMYSEGAKFPVGYVAKAIGRKVRVSKVGYLSQMNKLISTTDYIEIRDYIVEKSIPAILNHMGEKSFSLVFDNNFANLRVEPIDYWAKLNPREGQKPTLAPILEELIKKYTP